MHYSPDTYIEVKRLFVTRTMSGEAIAAMPGMPSSATVYSWAKQEDQHGKTWWQLRDEYREQLYDDASPRRIAQDFQAELAAILAMLRDKRKAGGLSVADATKLADAIGKITKSMASITDSRYQVPVMYEMLEDLLLYLHDKDILTPDLIDHIRDFKATLRARLEA